MKNTKEDSIEMKRSCSCAAFNTEDAEPVSFNKVVDSFHQYITRVTLSLFRLGDSLPKSKREDHVILVNRIAEVGAETINILRGYSKSKLTPQLHSLTKEQKAEFEKSLQNAPVQCVITPAVEKSPRAFITLRHQGDLESRSGLQDVQVGLYYWAVNRGAVMQVRVDGRSGSPRFPNRDAVEATFMASRFTGSLPAGTIILLHDLATVYFNDEVVANDFWAKEAARNT